MLEWIKALMSKMNSKGVPVPMIRSPDTGVGSVTLTLVFISFNVNLIALGGKAAGYFGGIDISGASYLFLMTLGAYLGRKIQGNGKSVDLSAVDDKKST